MWQPVRAAVPSKDYQDEIWKHCFKRSCARSRRKSRNYKRMLIHIDSMKVTK
ncbi:hypothetical protein Goari_014843, partial [Gossypium aridum]|nr:hypothetical protein [Gossypium aridum]